MPQKSNRNEDRYSEVKRILQHMSHPKAEMPLGCVVTR
jgi:hypothetical protein